MDNDRVATVENADTVVPDCQTDQLSLNASVVCRTVTVEDWSCHCPHAGRALRTFQVTYQSRGGHRHVYGANLARGACVYKRVIGFKALACRRFQELVNRLNPPLYLSHEPHGHA
ncbi:hypothetical protein IPC444_13400 [Pseudomonas aeruginosa]|uniref:hypothetical protein n=1 Tax=Pseudomonas aeruginosa TaxID=287 RepID=UPI000F863A74|nr:hypothetical protein [Pseudomonas aeruginosa]RUI04800.1 hypothetical protein IPC444_13400 [Pseudomonas aeruginosa]